MTDVDLNERLLSMESAYQRGATIDELINEALGQYSLCGCGTGNDVDMVWQVMSYYAKPHDDRDANYIYTDPGRELAAKLLDNAGIIEHGSGVGGGWFTPEGETIYEKLREYANTLNWDPSLITAQKTTKVHLEHLPEDIRDFVSKLLHNDPQTVDAIRDTLTRT